MATINYYGTEITVGIETTFSGIEDLLTTNSDICGNCGFADFPQYAADQIQNGEGSYSIELEDGSEWEVEFNFTGAVGRFEPVQIIGISRI